MSTPFNHHFVSQCQIKNFFNKEEKAIYLYDKERDNLYSKTSTKSVFSEPGLNSKLTDEETIDHESIEQDIKTNFEDSFRQNTNLILEGLSKTVFSWDFKHAIDQIAKLAIIGDFRTPSYKQKMDQTFRTIFRQIANHATPELRDTLETFFTDREKTKYSNALNYSEIAEDIFTRMGTVNHKIVWIRSNDYFVLPDCTSVNRRAKINEYFNPDVNEIAVLGIPITSKVFILTTSNKLKQEGDALMTIDTDNHDYVFQINGTLTQKSKRTIACESKSFLSKFIELYKNASAQQGI